MFKYILALFALMMISDSYASVNYNPSTGIYTVDQYGSKHIKLNEQVKFTKESKLTLPKKLMK